MKVKSDSEVTQLCLTLSDPMDCSPPGSSIHGILQARVLEWGAIAFSTVGTSKGSQFCLIQPTGFKESSDLLRIKNENSFFFFFMYHEACGIFVPTQGNAESYPLDCQASSNNSFFSFFSLIGV